MSTAAKRETTTKEESPGGSSHFRGAAPACGAPEPHVSERLPDRLMAKPVPVGGGDTLETKKEDTNNPEEEEEWHPLPRSVTLQEGNCRTTLEDDFDRNSGEGPDPEVPLKGSRD